MPQDWVIRGVPMALQRESWWLKDETPHATTTTRRKGPIAALLALTLLADILFYRQALGLSLALFATALYVAPLRRTPRPLSLITLILALLPVIDHVQALSLAILALGLPLAIALAQPALAPFATALTLLASLPWRGARDLTVEAKTLKPGLQPLTRLTKSWAFPLGGALLLTSLLVEANPVLDQWITQALNQPGDPTEFLTRVSFWTGMALMIWPFLATPLAPKPLKPQAITLPGLGLNAASVANALALFNLILALQTLLDARYLWSGTTPPGMTLASYAHRGAYPLLATALLAGAFALAARPYAAERRALKALLYLWLAQNILLTLSALYRLDLYVQSYGLTYLRLYAAIWMALVAAGLALTLTQIARQKSNGWLLLRCTLLGATTLYLCAFINFAHLIARVNIAEGKIDMAYLCHLGPTAAAALPATLIGTEPYDDRDYDSRACTFTAPQIHGWRDWGFRNWLVLHNLAAQEVRI